MSFDRTQPLRTTAVVFRTTGAAYASPARLWATLGMGLSAALIFARFSGAWWMSCWPVALACFSLWGLSVKATHDLDVRHVDAAGTRFALAGVRHFSKLLGFMSAFTGLLLMLGLMLRWEWVLDLVG